ncbi:MAG: DUF6512 family protein [Lachnospiraceae bacterium]
MTTYKKLTIFSIIITVLFGIIFHFIYDFFNQNFFIGLFSPINESIWEHTKLFFFPYIFYYFFFFIPYKKEVPNIYTAKAIASIVGILTIPILYYIYFYFLKANSNILDIAIFFISIFLAHFIEYYIATKTSWSNPSLSWFIFLVIFALYLSFTIAPPMYDLFKDPQANTYGMLRYN